MLLTVKNIIKAYRQKIVLNDVSFELATGSTMSILGRSGCGKTTLLKIIAGLEQQDSGNLFLNGKNIESVKPNVRNIVYLFQEPLLFPNMNVFENLAFGLRVRKHAEIEVQQKAGALLQRLELTDHITKMPSQLSGGQKQRVAFGRALIINPPLILLDEPFSSLDTETRTNMQILYKSVAADYSITALFVTHDVKEALLMGDTISYMDQGKLEIFSTKQDFVNDHRTGVRNEIDFWNNL